MAPGRMPPVDDTEIWRQAHHLLKTHGDEAEVVAADRADLALGRGEVDNFNFWRRVANAVAELSRQTPGSSEPLN
jgi:hypothetical protein